MQVKLKILNSSSAMTSQKTGRTFYILRSSMPDADCPFGFVQCTVYSNSEHKVGEEIVCRLLEYSSRNGTAKFACQ